MSLAICSRPRSDPHASFSALENEEPLTTLASSHATGTSKWHPPCPWAAGGDYAGFGDYKRRGRWRRLQGRSPFLHVSQGPQSRFGSQLFCLQPPMSVDFKLPQGEVSM